MQVFLLWYLLLISVWTKNVILAQCVIILAAHKDSIEGGVYEMEVFDMNSIWYFVLVLAILNIVMGNMHRYHPE